MELVAIVTALALLEYQVLLYIGAQARAWYKVPAPAVTGHPVFERHYRVQANTLEQLILFVPGMFLFGRYVSAPIAAMLGGVFILGRIIYAVAYVSNPERRTAGFILSSLPVLALVVGGLIGAALEWF